MVRKVPTFVNRMNKNERKYNVYLKLGGLFLGAYLVWLFAVLIPSPPGLNWQVIGNCILLGTTIAIYLKFIKYKKLIQFEDEQPALGDVKHD